MKKILFGLIFLAFSAASLAQVVSNGPGGFTWVDSPPTHNPGANGAKFAVNRNTFIWYEHISGTTWAASGDRIQTISGCSAPNHTPGNHQSRVVINGCTSPNVPELYFYTGSAWVKLNDGTTYTAGAGINISGTTIEVDTEFVATQYDLSQVGVSWPLLAPDGTTSAPSYSFQNSPGSGLWKDGATIILQSQSGEAGNPLLFAGGDASGDAEFAGDFTLRGGNATGSEGGGGRLFMSGGNSTGPLGQGGGVGIVGGNGTDVAGQVGIQGGTVNGVSLHRAPVAIGSQLTPWNLTTTERNTIPNALTSGVIYNTNTTANDGSTGALQLYNGSAWKSFAYDVSADLAGTGNRLAILNSLGRFQRGTIDPANVVSVTGPANGQIPKWNSATSTWVPANDSIGGGGGGSYTAGAGINITGTTISNTGVLGSGTPGRIPFFSLSQTIGSSGLTWDAVNNRLGINNASPTRTLSVTGDASISGRLLTSTSGIGGANGNEVLRLLDGGTSRRVHLDNNTDGIIQSIVGGTAGNNQMYYFASSFRLFPDAGHTGALSFFFFPGAAQESGITLGHPTATSQTGRAALDFANVGSSGGRSDAGQITFRQDYANAPTTGLRIYNRFGVNQTTGTYNNVVFDNGVTVSSGNANTVNTTIGGTINQTGTSSGFYTSLSINPTISNLRGVYTGLEILPNTGTAIIQSGAAATNRFAGSTIIGATTTPNASATAEVASTTGGVLFPRMTATQRDAITSPADGLVIYNTTAAKLQVRAAGAWVDLH